MEFVVVAEGPSDAQTACALADRVVFEEGPHWLDQYTRDMMRTWAGLQDEANFTRWAEIKSLAQDRGIGPLGHPKSGQPGGADTAQGRKAIILHALMTRDREAPALLLIRDTDADRESRRDFERARAQPETPDWLTVIIGVARPQREAWVLNGFEPETEEEQERLEELRRELGCDPRTRASTLTASASDALRNVVRVCNELTGGSPQRDQQCLEETDLSILRERGEESGLLSFLEEVETQLIPLFIDYE